MDALEVLTSRTPHRPKLQLSLLDSPLLSRRSGSSSDAGPKRSDKLVSLELDLGGLAIELKAKSLAGLLAWLSIDIALAAILQELSRPRQFRTWHGRVAGLVPYDFRKPSLRRMVRALWAPDDPHLFTNTAFGVGWSVNAAQVLRVLRGKTAATQTYEAPKVTNPSG
jgi:hypothetical protein